MSTPNTHEGSARIKACLKACADRKGSVFFIGVGGVMMSSLALLTARAGYPVFGSDRARTAVTDTLEARGITVCYGHDSRNIPADCGLVVYTVAISEDNPEYTEAHGRGIPCVSRADYLGALMTDYTRRVGVAGMHGKSTCTSMCAQILLDAEVDPTILSGATYAPMGGAYRLGDSKEHFLFEACEYMDSFLEYGAWNIKKLYLHLYPENPIVMDWDQPLRVYGFLPGLQTYRGGSAGRGAGARGLLQGHGADHRVLRPLRFPDGGGRGDGGQPGRF